MRQKAAQIGIRGWVANRADGCVEAVIQGNEPAVAAMLAWVQISPPLAKVAQVEQSTAEGAYNDFERRPAI